MPLVDTHNTSGIDHVLGVVDDIRSEPIEGLGPCLLVDLRVIPTRAELLPAIKDGFFQQLSAGYVVHEYEVEERDGDVPIARAVRWTLLEASLVPVGADANAMVRSLNNFLPPVVRTRAAASTSTKESKMDFETAVEAVEEAIVAVEEALEALPAEVPDDVADELADELAERARNVRSRLRAEGDEGDKDEDEQERKRGKRNDDEDDESGRGKRAEDEDEEVERARSIAKIYDLRKLADDMIALGARASEVKTSVRTAIAKRGAAIEASTTAVKKPSARSAATPVIDSRSIYDSMNKR